MGKHERPDNPTIIKRIIEECGLPNNEDVSIQRFSREQLMSLYFYVTEVKRTNKEYKNKIVELNQQGNEGKSGESKRP